jgi:ferredoxin
LIITGPTTGYVEAVAEEIRNHEGNSVTKASRGETIAIRVAEKIRPSDKLYKIYLLMFKLIHYRNRCIGCNACVEIAYQRWRMSKKDGKAVCWVLSKKGIYQIQLNEDELPENEQALEACPVKVIQIVR